MQRGCRDYNILNLHKQPAGGAAVTVSPQAAGQSNNQPIKSHKKPNKGAADELTSPSVS